MKKINQDFSIDEAVRTLSAYGLEEVQKVIGLSDDDVIDLLLDNCEHYQIKIMEWFANYINDSVMDLNERKFE